MATINSSCMHTHTHTQKKEVHSVGKLGLDFISDFIFSIHKLPLIVNEYAIFCTHELQILCIKCGYKSQRLSPAMITGPLTVVGLDLSIACIVGF